MIPKKKAAFEIVEEDEELEETPKPKKKKKKSGLVRFLMCQLFVVMLAGLVWFVLYFQEQKKNANELRDNTKEIDDKLHAIRTR